MSRPKKLKIEDVTLELVESSIFGCRNCLYQGCECRNRTRFVPEIYDNKPTCKNYCYFD